LNTGKAKIEDIIILHLEGATDFFITITASYLRSCFGCPLNYLIRFPNPVRTTSPIESKDPNEYLSIPKELWRITDYLFNRAMNVEQIFLHSGIPTQVEEIREQLDLGLPFDTENISPHSMAETLIRFLECLPEPVMPFAFYELVLASQNTEDAVTIVSSIPFENNNVFTYVVAFLRKLLSTPENGLTEEKITMLFSRVLMRPRSESQNSAQAALNTRKCANFLLTFLRLDENPVE